jgi:ABC-type bacteriocin/lantibiotic exporter with double-glycine peptidase domain
MTKLIDEFITGLDTHAVARRAPQLAYIAVFAAIVFGCLGWWNGPFTAIVTLTAVLLFVLGLRARTILRDSGA